VFTVFCCVFIGNNISCRYYLNNAEAETVFSRQLPAHEQQFAAPELKRIINSILKLHWGHASAIITPCLGVEMVNLN
jgi:hypothetical protein